MRQVMGLVNLHEDDRYIQELTINRPLAAVPFGGKYRVVDFILSNMVNSGVNNVGILMPEKYRSLLDHLRSGKEWDLARKRDGLFILPPSGELSSRAHKGNVEHLFQQLDYLGRVRRDYVLIGESHFIYNMDYRELFSEHLRSGADATLLYKEIATAEAPLPGAIRLQFEEGGNRIVGMEISPWRSQSRNICLNVCVLSKNLFVELVNQAMSRGGGDFATDCLSANISQLVIRGMRFDGFAARIATVNEFYRHNLDLLQPETARALFCPERPIYTKVKDSAPTKYKDSAEVSASMIANGCVLEGAVSGSVLFRGVKVQRQAQVRRSIIMQKTIIGEGSLLENVICDKDVIITPGRILKGDPNYPLVIRKGTVI